MRALGLLLLVVAALTLGFQAARKAPETETPAARSLVQAAARDRPRAYARHAADAPTTAKGEAPAPAKSRATRTESRHERLAGRAAAGDVGAALELAHLLEACTERDETRSVMGVFVQDWAAAPLCDTPESCAALERVYDEYQQSLRQWRAVERDCREVSRAWLETRGRWLRRAAELGDTEAMACYALAGVELAPHPGQESWTSWMDRWHDDALRMAWDAWHRGDPRGALALARIYAPTGYRGDASDLAEPNVRLEYRFALLVTRALDLDPGESEIAQIAAESADSFTPTELADEDAWVAAHLAAIRTRPARASRTPARCWEHFAVFEPQRAAPK